MITFLQSYRSIKKLAQLEGKTVQNMVENLIACWHAEQHRKTLERIDLVLGRADAQQPPKPAPKKRGRPTKTKQLELEPPKQKRRSPSQEARRNISRGVQLSWAKRKLEQAGIR